MPEDKSPFHRGEKEIQSRLGIRDRIEQLGRRMIQTHMPKAHQEYYSGLALLFVGTVDDSGRPWASVLAGKPGFLQPIDDSRLLVQARPIYGDPLNKSIVTGADIGTLGIEFETRNRTRVNGRIANASADGFEIQVAQSFGNCPQYIQARDLGLESGAAAIGEQRPVRRGKTLNKADAALIARSDTFFIASQSCGNDTGTDGIDVSHRGGMPGFVIVAHESSLLFPDYPGNCMFNTLGNLQVNPRAGLLFIDFETGDTLQITGEAEILWESHHTRRFPGAERVIAFRVEETLQVERALPVSWTFRDYSPVFSHLKASVLETPAADALPPMKLVSVNLSMPKEIAHDNKPVTTGIFKQPAKGRVMLHRLNLAGDEQADLWGHGGAFRAVYVYSVENYDYWQRELGRDDFSYGQFGENFTVENMLEDEIRIGDVFQIGDALVEVSQPRIPCYKLAIKMGVDNFQNRFLESGRTGFYFRVLEEGEVGAGDMFKLVGRNPAGTTVHEVSDLLFFNTDDIDGTKKALSIPALSHGWKGSFEERLAKAGVLTERKSGFRDFLVHRKEAESETITSFYLVPTDGAPLEQFLPGQFLSFDLKIPGQTERVMRTYSLSDRPNDDYYRVSIKREPPARPDLPPGLSSSYFHESVEVGSRLCIASPRGKFHLDPESNRAIVLLSAGVGLTPLIGVMNAIAHCGSGQPVWFIHGTRNSREHAMGEHVRRIARDNDNINAHIRYSDPTTDDVEGRDYDSKGRIDIALLKQILPFDNYDFYLCGPPPFMKSLYCGLVGLGIAEARIHYEFFGPASLLTDQAKPQGQTPTRSALEELSGDCVVTFARSGIAAVWDPDCESILELAEHQGLNPDYSCRSGICQTCMCRLVEGEVEYLEEPLNPPDPGQVLICICRPMSKIVIEV